MKKQQHPSRPTLADVARKAGVGKATASRAMNHDPRTSAKTAERVRRVAREMDYRPNPALAAIASRRFRTNREQEALPLAYIVARRPQTQPGNDRLFKSLESECTKLGYVLQHHNLANIANPARFCSELYHRGVGGIFLGRTDKDRFVERYAQMDWSPFAVVSLENNLPTPAFHLVRVDVWESIRICWRRLREQGHRRIGFILLEASEPRLDDEIREGAALKCQREVGTRHRAGILKLKQVGKEETIKIRDWMVKKRPDAVIVFNDAIAQAIGDFDISDQSIAVLHQPQSALSPWPGLQNDARKITRPASALMDRLFRHGEYGVPEHPQRVYVLPDWSAASIGDNVI